MALPPVIAIHGVGNHEPGWISDHLEGAFERASMAGDISEFNWDAFASHSLRQGAGGVTLLEQTAESISHAAGLPLAATESPSDRVMYRIGERLYDPVFRVLMASALALLILAPLVQLFVLLPSSMFQSTSWEGFGWIRAATRIALAAGSLVFLGLLGLGLVRSAFKGTVAPLWVTVRRGGLLILQPVILLLTVPVSVRLGSQLLRLIGVLIPLSLAVIGLAVLLSPLSGDLTDLTVGAGQYYLLLAWAAAFGALHVLLRREWIGGPLKVILDIVRYMGSPDYRTTLQRHFDEALERKLGGNGDGGRRVLLLSHSLGSVIALDSLVNSPAWTTSDSVVLVTLGCPVRRFFIRFFPQYLFPASIEASARLAASRLRHFSWINIHRPWDYVGGALGLGRDGLGADVSTGQARKVFSSHSDYWEDPVVIDTLARQLKTVGPVSVEPGPVGLSQLHVTPFLGGSPMSLRLARVTGKLAVALVVLVAGGAVFNFIQARGVWQRAIEEDLSRLKESGIQAFAEVTYYETVRYPSEDYTETIHHFLFRLPELSRQLAPIEISDTGLYDQRANYFDHLALAAFVLDKCTRLTQKKWWQVLKSEKSIPCTRNGIPFMYREDNPESFWLPGFPVQRGRSDAAVEVVVGLFVLAYFTVVFAVVILVGWVPLFRLFLGLDVGTPFHDERAD